MRRLTWMMTKISALGTTTLTFRGLLSWQTSVAQSGGGVM